MATLLWCIGIILAFLIAFFAWCLVRVGAGLDDQEG